MDTTGDIIRTRASKVVDAVRCDEVGVYRMIKGLVATTIKEYRGRFLHELIQNGYDAHPPGARDGRIAVHFLDEEGEHGVLYVANGGRPLSESNFLRMSSLGDSDKPIGVGIGNKGVGFKSVFQICDAPEVYSARDLDDAGFSGFSFRFGMPEDLDSYIDPSDPLRPKLESELSLSLLPVPLDVVPPSVAELRRQGFVTVLRLPASSERAADEIRERIDRLMASPSPIMLFLDRLATLSIQTSSSSDPVALTRRAEPDGDLTRVVLNDDERYLVFEGRVPSEDLAAALADAVAEGSLDRHWLEWKAEATVSVAVGDGWAVLDPAIFTYLPMGGAAASPLGAHVNAQFVTDFARLDFDHEQPVNRLMLRRIAAVCAGAAERLMREGSDAGAVVDLLSWNPDSLEWIEDFVSQTHGSSLAEFLRLPALGMTDWLPLSQLAAWPDQPCQVVTIDRLVIAAEARLIDASRVDSDRLDRLAHVRNGAGLGPSADTLAQWVECVAATLQAAQTPLTEWRAFYDDLSALFDSGEPLYGRRVLLAQSGDLVPADQPPTSGAGSRPGARRKRAVFFAPRTAGTEDDDAVDTEVNISPPRSLARRILFLHPDLEWYDGPQQTPGRKFLQDERLVRQFRTASLLTHLGQVMSSAPSAALKRDALDFAYRLFATNPARHSKELSSVGLAVPTIAGGWLEASTARFSRGWGVPGADDLSELAEGAPEGAPELVALAASLIAQPAVLGGATPDVPKWTHFLRVLGVTATLPINSAVDSRRMYGRSVTAANIAGSGAPNAVPAGVVEQWAAGITTSGNHNHPETYFTTNEPVCWFAGQHEIASLPTRLRTAYARLVVLTAPALADTEKWSTWSRDRPHGLTTSVESPLWSFLTKAEWVPVSLPNERDRVFHAPAEAWYVGVEDGMAAAYSPLIDPGLRRLMDSSGTGEACWASLGFQHWTSAEDAATLVDHLTELFAGGDVPETAGEHFRTSLAAAWKSVGDPEIQTRPRLDDALLVEVHGHLSITSKEVCSATTLFVAGTHDQTATTRLVRELGWPVVPVETTDGVRLREVADVLQASWSDDVAVTSEWELEVVADGSHWTAGDVAPRLVDEVPWLPLLIAACMRFPRASGMRVGKQLGSLLDEITRVRLVSVERLEIATAVGHRAIPARLNGVLPIPGDVPTLLTESHQSPPSWEQLEAIAQALLELLGQERFKAEVSLTIRDLSSGADHSVTRPTNVEIASILQVSEHQVAELETAVYGAVAGIVSRLQHVGPAMWGEVALEPFAEPMAASYSRDDLMSILVELCGDETDAARVLDAATDAQDANDLRQRLGVSLTDFNSSLALYFPAVPLTSYGAAHAEEFDLRRRHRSRELCDWARAARLERFDAGQRQHDWPVVRDLTFLEADPAWATTFDDVSTDLLDAHTDELMVAHFGPRATTGTLPDFETVQTANGRPLRTRLAEARRVVAVWCERQQVPLPAAWASDAFDSELRQQLDEIGALDFRELSEVDLATWLDRLAVWPRGMALSVAAASHGLSSDEVHAQEQADADAKAEKARAARRVQFLGADVDLDQTMSNLVDQVTLFLGTHPASLDTAYRTASLVEVVGASRRETSNRDGDGKGSGKGGVGITRRPSTEQTGAIGLVGEMVAFHWLKARDPSGLVDATCWKSGNSRFVIDGAVGDDGLGYDFEVPRRGGSVMYEVKATTGDAEMIELGETEVRCAQRFARSDRWRLLIVENAMAGAPRVHLLPNPFRHDSRGLFRFVGNSVRLRFNLP